MSAAAVAHAVRRRLPLVRACQASALTPSHVRRHAGSASTSPSILEASATDSYVKRRRQLELAKPPVPVREGETLLYIGGASTKRSVMTSWVGTGVLWMYLAAVKSAELASADLALLTPAWTIAIATIAGLTTFMAVSTTRVMMRYAVLTPDGQHLRLYAYGSVAGVGTSPPVTVPLAFLAESAGTRGAQSDTDALYVRVKESAAQVVFDKPTCGAPLPPGPGSSLTWTNRGLALQKGGLPKGAPSSTSGAGGLGLLTCGDKEELRRYALLALAVQGGVTYLDPGVVSRGEWELDEMKVQLGGRGKSAQERDVDDLALWRKAVDAGTGRAYWFHELTWATKWERPTVEGRGPEEWWPWMAHLPVHTVMTPPAKAMAQPRPAAKT